MPHLSYYYVDGELVDTVDVDAVIAAGLTSIDALKLQQAKDLEEFDREQAFSLAKLVARNPSPAKIEDARSKQAQDRANLVQRMAEDLAKEETEAEPPQG